MILKALYDYYQRKSEELPPFGTIFQQIHFILVIDKDGNFLRFEDRRLNKNEASQFLVKRTGQRTSGIVAKHFYDNISYVLGSSIKKGKKNSENNKAFRSLVEEVYKKLPENVAVKAVWNFYKRIDNNLKNIQRDPLWADIIQNTQLENFIFSFLLEGDTKIIASQSSINQCDIGNIATDDKEQVCLITGKRCFPVMTTYLSPLAGGKTKLVSFQKDSGYDSYGKEQGANAPISVEAEFAYSTALNHLLAKDSKNKFSIGEQTYIFWGSSSSNGCKETEESFFTMSNLNNREEEDPNTRILQVRKVFTGIYSGSIKTDLDDRFYIAGLAPGKARIAVVYWAELSLKDFAHAILRHFEDMEIVDARKEKKPYMGLKSILATVTLGGKSSEATPNLPDAVIKSIFQGLPYPDTLYHSCLRRIRAELPKSKQDKPPVSITRAAILKAYLNRKYTNQKPIQIMLDKENTNQGYLCGRLFAVIDKLQHDANHIHSIRERYMNAASSTPATVFATILNLSAIHANNLNNEGSRIFYDKLKQEIISKINADGFPSHLDLQDQGRFFVGYYQQMQSFFLTETKQTEE